MLTKVKTATEQQNIYESGQILAMVLKKIADTIEPGMSGIDIDKLVEIEVQALGGTSAFKGFEGFPADICISTNDELVHGIPTSRPFEKGDIVGFDYGVKYKGMITDSAVTLAVGDTDNAEAQRLLAGTREALTAGIKAIKGPTPVGDISAAVEAVLQRYKFGIVRTLVGHGVGHLVHEEPNIPNYGPKGEGMTLLPGMTIAIEPMATLGGDEVSVGHDGWTISTRDGSLSCQFEHTVLITESGAKILTKLETTL
jgi:methionyl aminopeptidase